MLLVTAVLIVRVHPILPVTAVLRIVAARLTAHLQLVGLLLMLLRLLLLVALALRLLSLTVLLIALAHDRGLLVGVLSLTAAVELPPLWIC